MYVSLTRSSIAVVAAALVITAPAVAGREDAPGTSKPDYQGTGVIVGLHPAPSSLHATRAVVVLRHDPIVGLMDESMEHPFIVASTGLFKGLKPGDRVNFEMKSTEDALLVISLRPARPPRRR
jgi:Cu/Ag efflux protein CusF